MSGYGDGRELATQRALDDLAFDPLPETPFVEVRGKWIVIKTRYSAKITALIHLLPGSEWIAGQKVWRAPVSSLRELRAIFSRLTALATAAEEAAQNDGRDTLSPASPEPQSFAIAGARPRLLRSEFLSPTTAQPSAILTLEAIADDAVAFSGARKRNRVEVLYGLGYAGRWITEWVPGRSDFRRANSVGSRGVYCTYELLCGPIYRIEAPQSWRSTDIYFAHVVAGEIVRLSEEEVMACLSAA